jgi:hypothetical protein
MSLVLSPERPQRPSGVPPLGNGDRLDQRTFQARCEAMPHDVRAELIGGIVYMSSPLKRYHGRYSVRLIRWLGEYEEATQGTEVLDNTTNILGPDSEPQPDGCLLILPECGGQTWENRGGIFAERPSSSRKSDCPRNRLTCTERRMTIKKLACASTWLLHCERNRSFGLSGDGESLGSWLPARTESFDQRCSPDYGWTRTPCYDGTAGDYWQSSAMGWLHASMQPSPPN